MRLPWRRCISSFQLPSCKRYSEPCYFAAFFTRGRQEIVYFNIHLSPCLRIKQRRQHQFSNRAHNGHHYIHQAALATNRHRSPSAPTLRYLKRRNLRPLPPRPHPTPRRRSQSLGLPLSQRNPHRRKTARRHRPFCPRTPPRPPRRRQGRHPHQGHADAVQQPALCERGAHHRRCERRHESARPGRLDRRQDGDD